MCLCFDSCHTPYAVERIGYQTPYTSYRISSDVVRCGIRDSRQYSIHGISTGIWHIAWHIHTMCIIYSISCNIPQFTIQLYITLHVSYNMSCNICSCTVHAIYFMPYGTSCIPYTMFHIQVTIHYVSRMCTSNMAQLPCGLFAFSTAILILMVHAGILCVQHACKHLDMHV